MQRYPVILLLLFFACCALTVHAVNDFVSTVNGFPLEEVDGKWTFLVEINNHHQNIVINLADLVWHRDTISDRKKHLLLTALRKLGRANMRCCWFNINAGDNYDEAKCNSRSRIGICNQHLYAAVLCLNMLAFANWIQKSCESLSFESIKQCLELLGHASYVHMKSVYHVQETVLTNTALQSLQEATSRAEHSGDANKVNRTLLMLEGSRTLIAADNSTSDAGSIVFRQSSTHGVSARYTPQRVATGTSPLCLQGAALTASCSSTPDTEAAILTARLGAMQVALDQALDEASICRERMDNMLEVGELDYDEDSQKDEDSPMDGDYYDDETGKMEKNEE